jgi:transcriptional regulator with XRE-family HTH domain
MDNRQVFAKRLRTLRKKRGFTQKELGSLLSVTDAAVGMWEQARRLPDPEMLARLAEVFNVSVDWLLGRVESDESRNNKNNNNESDITGDIYLVAESHTRHSYETEAAHRTDDPMADLPEEARRSLEDFKEYILKKYGMK